MVLYKLIYLIIYLLANQQ